MGGARIARASSLISGDGIVESITAEGDFAPMPLVPGFDGMVYGAGSISQMSHPCGRKIGIL
jgi:hypothetical protein